MSSTNLTSSNKGRAAGSPLVRQYSASMPNITLLTTAENDEEKILEPTNSKSQPAELDVAVPDTCSVDLLSTADVEIKDLQVVITNAAAFTPRNRIVSSTVSLNDMDLYLAKSRASCCAESRLKKLYFSAPHINMSTTPETANRVPPSATSSPAADDGVENPADRTMELRGDSGRLMSSTVSLSNAVDLYLAKSRASCCAEGRQKKLYSSAPDIIMSTTPETANRVPPSACTSSPAADDGVENPADRTMELRGDSGRLRVETAGHILCDDNEPGAGGHEHGDGRSHKSRSFWKRSKKFFRRLLCCTSSPEQ